MTIDEIHKNWTSLGQADAMWVVLTHPGKEGGKWSESDFFEHGREEIRSALQHLKKEEIPIQFGKALDFGCGLGRLSQALGSHFMHVDGVDISSSMIQKANALNKFPSKVHYHLNLRSDLNAFESEQYDFVYSSICLQHIPIKFQLNYISDFMRLLKKGGVAYFQTIHAHGWRKLVPDAAADFVRTLKHRGKAFMSMYGVPFSRVRHLIETRGGTLLVNQTKDNPGCETRFSIDVYIVEKQGQ